MLSIPTDIAPSVLARWRSKVDVAGPDDCHPWNAGCFENGYGAFRVGPKLLKAHRAGWMLLVGPIPPGMEVCHSCDNKPCQNRRHWFLGTTQDNTADRHAKGRDAKGLRNGGAVMAKLSREDRLAIRELYEGGMLQRQLAARYGVSQKTISNLLRKTRYGVRDTDLPAIKSQPKLTAEDAELIAAHYANGSSTQAQLADLYGISQVMVSKIARGWRPQGRKRS